MQASVDAAGDKGSAAPPAFVGLDGVDTIAGHFRKLAFVPSSSLSSFSR